MKSTAPDRLFAALNIAGLVIAVVVAVAAWQLVGEQRKLMKQEQEAMSEKPWLEYPRQPFALLVKKYKAGADVTYPVLRCNHDTREHVYMTSRRIVGEGADVLLQGITPVSIAPGCTTTTSAINHIPADRKPGIYHFAGAAEINGHALSWTVPWRTEEFEVIP